jgi:hypothetical protein
MAFIVDIRHGNLALHLMYKALFELSADRSEFVSRLFSKPQPQGFPPETTAADLLAAYASMEKEEWLYRANLLAIKRHLVVRHRFELSYEDLEGIEYVFRAFYRFGADLRYASTSGFGGGVQPSYAALMTATDGQGQMRGFLASEETFSILKDLHRRNLIVPVVGNFGGPKTIKSVAAYIRGKETTVSAFYLSNVEQYLRQGGLWSAFCSNISALPIDEMSTFIHAVPGRERPGLGLVSQLGVIATEVESCR